MSAQIVRLQYRVRPLPPNVVRRIRQSLTDDFGNLLEARVADSPAPCRSCLRVAAAGERLIVFAYRPFSRTGPYAEVGPVFIHADECRVYAEPERFPPDFVERALTLRGYNDQGTIETAEISRPGDPEASLARLFADERVRFVQVRNPAWGCFDFQIDRV